MTVLDKALKALKYGVPSLDIRHQTRPVLNNVPLVTCMFSMHRIRVSWSTIFYAAALNMRSAGVRVTTISPWSFVDKSIKSRCLEQ